MEILKSEEVEKIKNENEAMKADIKIIEPEPSRTMS